MTISRLELSISFSIMAFLAGSCTPQPTVEKNNDNVIQKTANCEIHVLDRGGLARPLIYAVCNGTITAITMP